MAIYKVSKLKNFLPTLQVIKPVRRNSRSLLANQTLKNLDRFNKRAMRSSSFFLSPLKDNNIEDTVTIISNKYKIKSALPPNQDKQVQFEEEKNGVYDILEPKYYQKKTFPSQKDINWFQLAAFLNTLVTLLIWQFLNWLP